MADDSDGGRATVKQVYDAVGDTRKELGDKIDALGDRLDAVVVAHEHRLTKLESTDSAHAERLVKVEAALDTLKTEHNVAKGHVKALAIVGGILGTILASGLSALLYHVL